MGGVYVMGVIAAEGRGRLLVGAPCPLGQPP